MRGLCIPFEECVNLSFFATNYMESGSSCSYFDSKLTKIGDYLFSTISALPTALTRLSGELANALLLDCLYVRGNEKPV